MTKLARTIAKLVILVLFYFFACGLFLGLFMTENVTIQFIYGFGLIMMLYINFRIIRSFTSKKPDGKTLSNPDITVEKATQKAKNDDFLIEEKSKNFVIEEETQEFQKILSSNHTLDVFFISSDLAIDTIDNDFINSRIESHEIFGDLEDAIEDAQMDSVGYRDPVGIWEVHRKNKKVILRVIATDTAVFYRN